MSSLAYHRTIKATRQCPRCHRTMPWHAVGRTGCVACLRHAAGGKK